ncbi:hypothetical protein [Salinibacter grassmerensis]|uniref:hypothetical protein n=1 Tax=Salinibacter grassmerensis TaxID=3040353 RepID=UPI0021E77CAA|nr:hypothetical protein [Salinibacter grassmerensis]
MLRCAAILLGGVLLGACSTGETDVTGAEETWGTSVDATEAVLASAVAAEASAYEGRPVAVEGRIAAVGTAGCEVTLAAGSRPLVVAAPATEASGCAWTVPGDAQGFAVATGTLRTTDDTLRLTADGVRVTPIRPTSPASPSNP